jgi:hypothetical protein
VSIGPRTARWLLLLPLLVGCQPTVAPPAGAGAEPKTLLWGIYRDCRRDPYLSGVVEKRLFQLGGELLRLLPGPAVASRPPEAASAELLRSCPELATAPSGAIILGGSVEERGSSPPYSLLHLWRFDPQRHELRYRDHYCRGCDIGRSLAGQALALLAQPPPPSPVAPTLPTFCADEDAAPPAAGDPSADQRTTLHVRSRPQAAGRAPALLMQRVSDALQKQLQLTLRDAPARQSPGEAAPPLRLTVELIGRDSAELALSGSGLSSDPPLHLDCPQCSPERFAEALSRAAGRLLDAAVAKAAEARPAPARQPLLPEVRRALCTAPPTASCPPNNSDPDSGPLLLPFYDPPCGQPIRDFAAGR